MFGKFSNRALREAVDSVNLAAQRGILKVTAREPRILLKIDVKEYIKNTFIF